MGLQSPQSDCNSSSTYIYSWSSNGVSVTAISTIQLQSTIRLQKFLNLHIQLVIQRRVGDCNLHNPTAISAIQLQSPQSNCNLRNPTAISTIRVQKFLNLHIQLVNPT